MNIIGKKSIYALGIIGLILLPGCTNKQCTIAHRIHITPTYEHLTQIDLDQVPTTPPAINVWVHGTKLFPDPILHHFFYSKPGLHLATSMDTQYRLRTIAEELMLHDPNKYPRETFYLFGWSGKLCFNDREQAGLSLYQELNTLSAEYKRIYNIKPFIRLICHSHGGNVALNLAKMKSANDALFKIDELVLLACPVQNRTKQYIHEPLFKKVYSLYSHLDFVQILDPQGLYKANKKSSLFSKRCFDDDLKLSQVKIHVDGRAITHTEFILPKFLGLLAQILREIDNSYPKVASCTKSKDSKWLLSVHTKKNYRLRKQKAITITA